jgi:hypothetical protein
MAREESSREDLLREATALVERIELRVSDPICAPGDRDDHIIVGFRDNGSASFFFGDDPVYQFSSAGELRRAYCDGLLYKASQGCLVSLQRIRRQNEVQLLSRRLDANEQNAFVTRMRSCLRDLIGALQNGRFEVIGQVPAEADILNRVRNWLATHDGLPIAITPRAV